MTLTSEELEWTLTLKSAVVEDAELKDLSDFEYAQHAITSRGDTNKALIKVVGLQQFREEYNVLDTLEEGMRGLEAFQKQQPWFVLDVEYEPQFGHFVCVYDYGVVNHKAASKMPGDFRIYIVGLYYIFQLLQANIGSIREGLVHIVECEGVTWENFNVDFSRNQWHHMIEFYPIINKEISWLHTSILGNMMHAFFKSLQKEVADVIRVGCQFEAYDGRLDEVFKMPSPEIAEARLMSRYETFLAARLHNQSEYSLPARANPTQELDGQDERNDET